MKQYRICFWQGANNEGGNFKEFDCLISQETIEKLLNEQPRFIRVFVDDGEEMILTTENINHFKEIYEESLKKI